MTTVRLLQVRYAASPDGPWGEPVLFSIYEPDEWAGPEWSEPKRTLQVFRSHGEFFQKRYVEYVPLEPAQVDADVSELLWIHDAEPPGGGLVRTDATDPLAGSIAFSPRDADSFVRQHNAQVMKAAALRSRPAVVDAEVELKLDSAHAWLSALWYSLEAGSLAEAQVGEWCRWYLQKRGGERLMLETPPGQSRLFRCSDCRKDLKKQDPAPVTPAEPVDREGEAPLFGRVSRETVWRLQRELAGLHPDDRKVVLRDEGLCSERDGFIERLLERIHNVTAERDELRSRPAAHQQALPAGAVDEREARRDEAEACQWCNGYGSLVPGRDDATPCGQCRGTGRIQGEPRPYTLTTASASGPCGGCDGGYLEGQAVAIVATAIAGDSPVMHPLCAIRAVKKFDARKGTP